MAHALDKCSGRLDRLAISHQYVPLCRPFAQVGSYKLSPEQKKRSEAARAAAAADDSAEQRKARQEAAAARKQEKLAEEKVGNSWLWWLRETWEGVDGRQW
jgi:hypothetical protein